MVSYDRPPTLDITLEEFELGSRAFEINKLSVELAREAAESFADGRDRWVVGDIGPGTKPPTLGHIDYDTLEAALVVVEPLLCLIVDASNIDNDVASVKNSRIARALKVCGSNQDMRICEDACAY